MTEKVRAKTFISTIKTYSIQKQKRKSVQIHPALLKCCRAPSFSTPMKNYFVSNTIYMHFYIPQSATFNLLAANVLVHLASIAVHKTLCENCAIPICIYEYLLYPTYDANKRLIFHGLHAIFHLLND